MRPVRNIINELFKETNNFFIRSQLMWSEQPIQSSEHDRKPTLMKTKSLRRKEKKSGDPFLHFID